MVWFIGRIGITMWLYSSDDLRHLGGRKLHHCIAPEISAERTSSIYRPYVVQLGPFRSGLMRSSPGSKTGGSMVVFILPLDMGHCNGRERPDSGRGLTAQSLTRGC
jgi:hypothetical protein